MSSFGQLQVLHLENMGRIVPVMQILRDMPARGFVRIIGLSLTLVDGSELSELYRILSTMRGRDENGNNTDSAVVSGEIVVEGTVAVSDVYSFTVSYPDVRIVFSNAVADVLVDKNGRIVLDSEGRYLLPIDGGYQSAYTGDEIDTFVAKEEAVHGNI